MNFSDIVQGEDGFLVELRCNNTFQVQLFGKIKAYLLENQPEVPDGRLPQDIRQIAHSGVILFLTQSPYLKIGRAHV